MERFFFALEFEFSCQKWSKYLIIKHCARRCQRCHQSGIRINYFNIALVLSPIVTIFIWNVSWVEIAFDKNLLQTLQLSSEMLEFFVCLVEVIWCTRYPTFLWLISFWTKMNRIIRVFENHSKRVFFKRDILVIFKQCVT